MKDGDGHIREERREPEHPVPDGKRWYDPPQPRWPKIPVQKILLWITFAGVMLKGINLGLDWIGKRANVGMAAEVEKIHTRLDEQAARDSVAQIERRSLAIVQATQAQQMDTIKQGIIIFAERICAGPRESLTLGERRRCNILFNGPATP